jgi:hypothetical protein
MNLRQVVFNGIGPVTFAPVNQVDVLQYPPHMAGLFLSAQVVQLVVLEALMVQPVARNTMAGFSERTLKNLAYIYHAREQGADVHVVTQLILSLMGLIIFPWEEIRSHSPGLLQIPMHDLYADGWPRWNQTLGQTNTLYQLIRHVRNALSHRRVTFSSDSRVLSEVHLYFADRPPGSQEDTWRADVNAAHFGAFVAHFSEFLGA